MRLTHVRMPALIGSLLLTACGDPIGRPERLDQLPRPLTAAENRVIAASNDFAFNLLREADRERKEENVFLSPLSASLALGMTMNGARGETFDAMRSALAFGSLTQAEINASYRGLIDLLRELDPRVQMQVANSIWYRNTYPFHTAFFDTTRTYFDAEVAGLDFNDPGSVRRVNAWVDKATSGKIDEILDRIRPEDVMYLVNAIYFKGSWTKRFDPANTRDGPFYDAAGTRSTGTVKMMQRVGPIRFYRGTGFEAADLPYGNGAFSMTILLPERGGDAGATLQSLDAAGWAQIVDGLADASMGIALPKFRMEYKHRLNHVLTRLGMGRAFGIGGPADFTGMSPRGEELVITDVLQKTFIDVHEEGTEAAAVTKVTMGVVSAPATFTVDRPFVFVIRERLSGTILFMGKIVAP